MKLLIVDDEIIIRTGISQAIDWTSLGIEVLTPAASAEEAMQQIALYTPQIVLTDIRMGGISGLELAHHIRAHHPQTEVIILSGYDDFNYAQQALREGVSDYLLKTSRPEEIVKTMVRAKQRIQERQQAEKHNDMRQDVIRKQFLEQLLLEGTIHEPHLGQAKQLLQLEPPSQSSYQVMLIAASGWDERRLLYFAIENILQEMMLCDTIIRADHLLVLLQYEGMTSPLTRIQSTITRMETLMKCSIFAALGSCVMHYTDWHLSYQQAKQTLSYRYITDKQNVLQFTHIEQRTGGRTVCSREEEGELSSILAKGNHAELMQWIRRKREELLQDDQATPSSTAAYLQSIMISGYRWLERVRLHPTSKHSDSINRLGAPPSELGLQEKLQQDHPEELLYRICCSIMEEYQASSSEQRGQSYVQQAITYIRGHLHTNLSLQQVAKQVHLHPNHFSEVFKKEMGMTCLEFMTRERMERAIEMLKESDMKIARIANLVGYGDIKYFTQLFKKYTGQTPSSYRERN